MSTEKQIAANQLNAQKSTGPITPEGKAISSRNALRHGFYARTAILPRENQQEFGQYCADLVAELQPQTTLEHYQVEQMAVSYWMQKRLGCAFQGIFQEKFQPKEQLALLNHLDQMLARQRRAHTNALKALQSLQAARLRQEQKPPESKIPDARPAPAVVSVMPPPVVMAPNGGYHDPSPELRCLPNET